MEGIRMKVKVTTEFLEVPRGTIGQIIEQFPSSCKIKFECKDAPVHVQWPGSPFFIVFDEPEAPKE